MEKENIILVNSFYANSVILKGFVDYLSESFNTYFIDLPGFSADSPPLAEVSLENFSRYVQRRIEALELESYIVIGISFGFLVVNAIPHDGKCKAIVGITPYLGADCLKLGFWKKTAYIAFTSFFASTGLARRVWKTRLLRRLAHWYSVYPAERVNLILDHMDGKTFFETGRLILRHRQASVFQGIPYVLIANQEDSTIHYEYLVRIFRENAQDLLLINTGLDHYPQEISKEYFKAMFRPEDLEKIVSYINSCSL